MEAFIRNDQYNFIQQQVQTLINGHATVTDTGVLNALKSLALEKVLKQFAEINDNQKRVLNSVTKMEDRVDAEIFLAQLKAYVIPFPALTEPQLLRLFPKVKKLKLPSLEQLDLKATTYLSWIDKGSGKKFIVAPYHDKLTGLQGTFTKLNQQGICMLCNSLEEVGMFVSEKKGKEQGTFVKKGKYICQNSQTCNRNIMTLDKLTNFIKHLSK